MATHESARMDRREALKWILTAATTVSFLNLDAFGAEKNGTIIGSDPNLQRPIVPWNRTFTPEQLRTARALCDVIIPADDRSPSAASVGVADFIDEWVSAPYPAHEEDRKVVLEGFAWLEAEANQRFKKSFADLAGGEQTAICDDICYLPKAKPEFKAAAAFFANYRNLTAGGFYTTDAGMKDIKYIGNIPLTAFPGATPEALRHLGLSKA